MQIYEELESAIYKWQFSVRERTGNRNFRAVPHLADACEVTEGTFYKWLEGDLNGTKLGLSNFAKIVIETEDIDLLNAFIDEIKSKIQIKHAVK